MNSEYTRNISLRLVLSVVVALSLLSCANGSKSSASNQAGVSPTRTMSAMYQVVQIPQTAHKIESVGEGMTKEEIKAVMGQPDKISDMCCSKDKPKIWSYQGIKCFENEVRPEAKSQFSGNCEVHFDKEDNRVVGWDKKTSRVIVTQRQCIANCN